MIDPNLGDLEKAYMSASKRDLLLSDKQKSKLLENYQGKPVIDRTNQILKRLQMQTPGVDANLGMVKSIQQQARNKVSYAYKERYCGIYEERKRNGQLKRENSWDKFVNPDKIGLDNYMQHALNTEAGEQLKDSQAKD